MIGVGKNPFYLALRARAREGEHCVTKSVWIWSQDAGYRAPSLRGYRRKNPGLYKLINKAIYIELVL